MGQINQTALTETQTLDRTSQRNSKMNKLLCLSFLILFVALCCAYPSEERNEAREERREFLSKRHKCGDIAKAALRKYGILNANSVECGNNAKRWASEFEKALAAKEKEHTRRNYSPGEFSACCSPGCDWLLDYLEIDSTVVKCLDKK